jgi:hypothetical protein
LLTENFQNFAGTNSNILGELTSSLTPIQEAGPGQFGFTPTEAAAMRTDAAEQLNSAGANATNAVRSALASQGGGTTYLPSGSAASILGSLAQNTAVQEAEAQSGITQAGYAQGNRNWLAATQELAQAPGELENPVSGAGGAAVSGANLEQQGANAITQANQAWMQPVGQILGGIAGGAMKLATGGAAGGVPPIPTPPGEGPGGPA